jgi:hypothetical protein
MIGSVVEDQFGCGETVFEGDPMDVADVFTEPRVERLIRGAEGTERGVEIVGLDHDHRHVSKRGRWIHVDSRVMPARRREAS